MSVPPILSFAVVGAIWYLLSQRDTDDSERVLTNVPKGSPVDPTRPPPFVEASPNDPELNASRLPTKHSEDIPDPKTGWVPFGVDIDASYKAHEAQEQERLVAAADSNREVTAELIESTKSEQIAVAALRAQYNGVM